MPLTDIVPMTWTDSAASLTDVNFNTEIRDSYLLLLNPPACGLQKTANFNLANSTNTAVSFDTVLYDTLSDDANPQFSVSQPTRITANVSGWYECTGTARIVTPGAAMILTTAFRVNGSTMYYGGSQNCSSVVTTLNSTATNLIFLSATDYVEMILWQNEGATQVITATGLTPIFSMIRRRGA